jgi:hypothetical protein
VITVQRPLAEPGALDAARQAQLPLARAALNDSRASHLTRYGSAPIKRSLFEAQHEKCAYCEWKLPAAEYQDVEHYRPKSHYWWLTWEWSNLLFACVFCNRTHKKHQFPLVDEAVRLQPEELSPGEEDPLVIDPSSMTPISDHIRFRRVAGRWQPVPVNGSAYGDRTITVLGLAQSPVVDAYQTYFAQHIEVRVDNVLAAIAAGDNDAASLAWNQATVLTEPEYQFAALAWGALDELVPDSARVPLGLAMPPHP